MRALPLALACVLSLASAEMATAGDMSAMKGMPPRPAPLPR